MHLLLAAKGTIAEDGEAIDLGQSPGDLLVLSAADTELSSLAFAVRRLGGAAPKTRLASFLKLTHPLSIDTYVERTARHAKLIVLRIIGGATYWPYGLEALLSLAQAKGIALAVMPGDDKPDPGLDRFNTVPLDMRDRLWRHLAFGGPQNAEGFLRAARAVMDGGEWPPEPEPLPKAGVLVSRETHGRPVAAVIFYRALVQSGQTQAVEAFCDALEFEGLAPLPVFVASLKDAECEAELRAIFARTPPSVVVNCTGFAVSSPGAPKPTVLDEGGAVVLQAVLAGISRQAWEANPRGLTARDLAMNVGLPELDGRVLSRAIAFKSAGEWDETCEIDIVAHEPMPDRVAFTAKLAAAWARLREKPAAERRVAIVLANYPGRDDRIGNGVGLDTPAGTVEALNAMREAGFDVGDAPRTGAALMAHLLAGPTPAGWQGRTIREALPLHAYRRFFDGLPETIRDAVTARWGAPEEDPFFAVGAFALPVARFGKTLVGIQPARGRAMDPKDDYHDPELYPPHHYIAFHAFLREGFGADAVVHMGKHGNLEWLPGKAMALSQACVPEALLGPRPHLYPFIVNDPGEGTQAKRRTAAVIVSHLTPPLTRAETYGPLKDLEALVDEYYEAAGSDARRTARLERQILDLVRDSGIGKDAGIAEGADEAEALQTIDAWLCDLKELQIRDGLHVFGKAPEGALLTSLTLALARLPRGLEPGEASLLRALAADVLVAPPEVPVMPSSPCRDLLPVGEKEDMSASPHSSETRGATPGDQAPPSPVPGEGARRADEGLPAAALDFDPLDCDLSTVWTGPRPQRLKDISTDPWRTTGDTVERLEALAHGLVSGAVRPDPSWSSTAVVLREVETRLKPSLVGCGEAERQALIAGLSGRFVPPSPSGAPTRGRPDVLPTGRNFYSVDTRAVPTQTAWNLGRKSAELLVRRHLQDHGEWPRAVGLSVWGTSNMRTGGDDLAQALALIGAKPVWDPASRRVTGFEIVPPAALGRPRVDVTLRISGFFRDAFPEQIAFFDKAMRAIGALDEDEEDNPIAARMREETAALMEAGRSEGEARAEAGHRIFGARAGGYGAGLEAVLETGRWTTRADLAEAYLATGAHAYGGGAEGAPARERFEARLAELDAVVQNQDNREHDILDSDEYWQFEGGMAAAAEALAGAAPALYHNDHSRPESPRIGTLGEEVARIVRGRVVNPRWIAGAMRHGYKGASEITASVDMLFGFAATTDAVASHHFDLVHAAFVEDEAVADFMREANPRAFEALRARLAEALARGFWHPRSNSARMGLTLEETA